MQVEIGPVSIRFSKAVAEEKIDMKMKMVAVSVITIVIFGSIGVWGNENRSIPTERASSETAGLTSPKTGVVSVISQNSFEITWTKLIEAIESNAALKIISIVDHAENAKKTDQPLRPTRLVIFGNPLLGTPMMQASQTVALDLPQKMIVFENEKGEVYVAYNDPGYVAKRHSIAKDNTAIKTVAKALKDLARSATKK